MSQAPSKLLCQKSLSFSSRSNQAKILANRCWTNHLLGADSDWDPWDPFPRGFTLVVKSQEWSCNLCIYIYIVTTCLTYSIDYLDTHDSIGKSEILRPLPPERASVSSCIWKSGSISTWGAPIPTSNGDVMSYMQKGEREPGFIIWKSSCKKIWQMMMYAVQILLGLWIIIIIIFIIILELVRLQWVTVPEHTHLWLYILNSLES